MKTAPILHNEIAVDHFARSITSRLSEGEALLPYEVTERLRASRERAVAERCRGPVAVRAQNVATTTQIQGNTLTLGGAGDGHRPASGSWWRALISAIPVIALVSGLVIVNTQSDQSGLSEVTEVDTALLTDDLPPAAYADPGFIQYLKTSATSAER